MGYQKINRPLFENVIKIRIKPLLSPIEQYVVDVVRVKRIEKGWSQKELAYQLDVSIGFIGDIENPKYRAKFNLNHINELAKIFECSPKDFLPENTF